MQIIYKGVLIGECLINMANFYLVCGISGGGKTTSAELIARYFDVTEGEIKIGGVNVKNIPVSQLMDTVSFVFQDSKLIKTSILENVRLGNPKASEEDVLVALKKAQCMDIIEKFPDGIHTVIGTKGVFVSVLVGVEKTGETPM